MADTPTVRHFAILGRPRLRDMKPSRFARRGAAGLLSGLVVSGLVVLGAAPAIAASTSKITPSFVAKANVACAGFSAGFHNVGEVKFPYPNFNPTNPQPSLLMKVGKYFDKGVRVWESVPRKLRALGVPGKGETTWRRLRTLARRVESLAVAQARMATAGNAKGFTEDVRKLTAVTQTLNQAAHAGGFSESSACAKFFG
ncbi:MAG TPA: hypothetical protein VND62_07545 [Acidimicrobiales bacterium]|nr:hypothetical protein [Acidimicrobiales bacterium]